MRDCLFVDDVPCQTNLSCGACSVAILIRQALKEGQISLKKDINFMYIEDFIEKMQKQGWYK